MQHTWTFPAISHEVQSVVIGWQEFYQSKSQVVLLHPIPDADEKHYTAGIMLDLLAELLNIQRNENFFKYSLYIIDACDKSILRCGL